MSSSDAQNRQRGQALVEFALIAPILMGLIMGLFEFGVALAVNIGVNRAAQNGAHMASQAGNIAGADCLILDEVERSLMTPNDRARVETVHIELTDLSGDHVYATNVWTRAGSTTCAVADGLTMTLPYSRTSSSYPDVERCNVLSGCPTMTPPRSIVDNIGVTVAYRHQWITPMGMIIPLLGAQDGSGWSFQQRNIFRMEPHR